jgi:hypothetical protein
VGSICCATASQPAYLEPTYGSRTPGPVKTAAIVVLLAAATALSRAPFLAPRLAHWDAVNYALGLHDFDIAAHQPHPPGSPYFILAGRAVLMLVGDDNSALLLISVIASIGAVLAEYVLARLLFQARTAFVAAVVLMTQPVLWGYGTTASAWTVLACLGLSIGLISLLLMRGHARLSYPSALLMGVASGFRLDAAVFLSPLWLWAMFTTTPEWRRRAVAVGIAVIGLLVWLVPVVADSGGILVWSQRLLALLPAQGASAAAVARQLAANTAITLGMLAFTVGPALVLSYLIDKKRAMFWLRATLTSKVGIFWALWILPALTFLWLVDKSEPGHDLIYTGALVALGVGLLAHSAVTPGRLAACGALIAALQAGVFLFAAPQTGRPLDWTMNSMMLNVTEPGARLQQSSLDSTLRMIRARFEPRATVVLTVTGQDAYRFMMYYLPEYTVVRLDPETRTALVARDKKQGNLTEVGDCLFVDGDAHHIVWVLSTPAEPGTVPRDAALVSDPADGGPFQTWEAETNPVGPDYLGFTLSAACAT